MPMSDGKLAKALLEAHRIPQMAAKIPDFIPSLDEAYQVQRSVGSASNLPVMVWKLGLTSEASQQSFDATEPVVGRLPASAIFCDRSHISFVGSEMYAEAELIFELGQDLPVTEEPYTRGDLIAVIKGVYAGIEIVRTRFQTSDLPLGLLVADNVMAHGIVLGKKLASGWHGCFSQMPATLTRNDDVVAEGSTARVMGNPLDALVWLANWMRMHEQRGFVREQLIASGTCTGATEIFPGDKIMVEFDGVVAAQVSTYLAK